MNTRTPSPCEWGRNPFRDLKPLVSADLYVNEYFFFKVVWIVSRVDKELSPAKYFAVIKQQKLQQMGDRPA
jgi:hypothetical protein